MLRILPKEKILTETDAPYLPPLKGTRNEPMNVLGTVGMLASIRGWSLEEAQQCVCGNFKTLFSHLQL